MNENFQKLTHSELLERQSRQRLAPKIPLVVVLNNIRSLYNVGSIFRTADGAGVEKIWLCGITGIPPSEKIAKTALDAEKHVPWEFCRQAEEVARQYQKLGYEIVLLEQTKRSLPYHDYSPQKPVCLILGNEINGVGESLLPLCDQALEIEMAGVKNSLNVTVAFGVVAYHLRQKLIEAAGVAGILSP